MNISANTELHSWTFEFERQFRPVEAIEWMDRHKNVAYYIVVIYLGLLYVGTRYMKTRPPFEIKGLLVIWNLGLSIFSIIGVVRAMPEIIHTIITRGFHFSVCSHCEEKTCTFVGQFWLWAFAASKVIELGDTAFIVLRKRPLFFLHWYHHVTVLLYTWHSYASNTSSGRLFFIVNLTIHSVMYTYYTLKAFSVHVPRSVSMTITVAQLSQMVLGCYITYYVYDVKRRGINCMVSDSNMRASMVMYTSYFCLFLWYFYQSYFVLKSSHKHDTTIKTKKQK